MRKWTSLLIILAFLLFLPDNLRAAPRPNFLVVQTDDVSYRAAFGTFRNRAGNMVPVMPRLQAALVDRGAQFTNFHTSSPICSPSRASLLSGKLPHNSGVVYNNHKLPLQSGGWPGWKASASYEKNFIQRLQLFDYQTAHFGKFLNHYQASKETGSPPGWDTWSVDATDDSTRDYYGYYTTSSNPFKVRGPWGSYRRPDPVWCSPARMKSRNRGCNYHTDRMTSLAAKEIQNATRPFYIQVDYHAWHGDYWGGPGAEPATRHKGMASRAPLPRPPNWNEEDIADKPSIMRRPSLSRSQQKRLLSYWRNGVESLRSVDEGIGMLLETLAASGKLDNTYIIFLSDNGIFLGEHRLAFGKNAAYEEAARIPFVVRGPGINTSKITAPALITDIAPSILQWAGVSEMGLNFDGLPLQPLLQGEQNTWRPLWISSAHPTENRASTNGLRYRAVRLGPYKYIRHWGGEREIYDLRYDPYEDYNQVGNLGYSKLIEWLDQEIDRARTCSGEECSRSVQPPHPFG